jgi:hypothetical protein
MLAARNADPRLEARSNVFLSAILIANQISQPVRVRNISTVGALIDGADLPAEGATVSLQRGALQVGAAVAWRDRAQCGLRFETEVIVANWVRRVEHAGQQRVDEIVSLIRSRSIDEVSDITVRRADDSLQLISADLGEISERLAGFTDLVGGCPADLLQLGAIAQRLNRLANGSKA